MTTARPIVVGIDGSSDANSALAWAADEAVRRGAELWVVHVWSPPHLAESDATVVMATDVDELEASARRLLDVTVDGVLVAAAPGRPQVERRLIEDHHPGRALIDLSRGADLLVVGSRGRGGFDDLLLGSVSHQCVHHAACPVVVVRTPAR